MKPLNIGVDFDGTIVTHDFPQIGQPVDHALHVLHELQDIGHNIILFTMRSHVLVNGRDTLEDAVHYLTNNGIKLFGVNENPTQYTWTSSPKPYCHIFIDDAALGCPLIHGVHSRPFVDWNKVYLELRYRGVLR